MKFDDFLLKSLGEFGKFQAIQLVLVCIPITLLSMDALSWTFASIETPYRCKLAEETSPLKYQTDSLVFSRCFDRKTEETRNISDWGKEGILCEYSEKCSFQGAECKEHIFDHSWLSYTAIEKWQIVCDHSWIKALVQAVYYFGMMVGSYVFGVIGDRFGRKKAFYLALTLQIPFNFLTAFSPFWWLYAMSRFIIGMSHAGLYLLSSVVGMESVGPKYRKMAAIGIAIFSTCGIIGIGVLAMFVTNYTHMHLITAFPALIYISFWWIVPESARWLVSRQRYSEADAVVRKAAKWNGKDEIADDWWDDLDSSQSGDRENLSTVDLFRTPKIRRRTLVLCYTWPVTTMVYYGISLKANVLGGDIYLNFLVSAIIEIPSSLTVLLLIDRVGRRLLLPICLVISSSSFLLNLIMGENVQFWVAIVQMMVAKGTITMAFTVLLTFSPELYPTAIRNTAMGLLLTLGRFGGVLASFVSMFIAERFGKIFMILPFGVCALIGAALSLLILPETAGKPLPDTLDDVENPGEIDNVSDSESSSKSKSKTSEK